VRMCCSANAEAKRGLGTTHAGTWLVHVISRERDLPPSLWE